MLAESMPDYKISTSDTANAGSMAGIGAAALNACDRFFHRFLPACVAGAANVRSGDGDARNREVQELAVHGPIKRAFQWIHCVHHAS